jgi:hypothetical protein
VLNATKIDDATQRLLERRLENDLLWLRQDVVVMSATIVPDKKAMQGTIKLDGGQQLCFDLLFEKTTKVPVNTGGAKHAAAHIPNDTAEMQEAIIMLKALPLARKFKTYMFEGLVRLADARLQASTPSVPRPGFGSSLPCWPCSQRTKRATPARCSRSGQPTSRSPSTTPSAVGTWRPCKTGRGTTWGCSGATCAWRQSTSGGSCPTRGATARTSALGRPRRSTCLPPTSSR